MACRKQQEDAAEAFLGDVLAEMRPVVRERLLYFWSKGIRGGGLLHQRHWADAVRLWPIQTGFAARWNGGDGIGTSWTSCGESPPPWR